MNKCVKFVSFVSLLAISGSAFAQTGPVFDSLDNAAGQTSRPQAPAVPPPSVYVPAAGQVALQDITASCTRDGDVVSAYPGVYKLVHNEENSRVMKVFRFTDASGAERRVEVYYTGGDWMQYGFTYVATNAGAPVGQVRIYFVAALSTPDREEGAVPPQVDPFDGAALQGFLSSRFLDAGGAVRTAFPAEASLTR